MKFNDYWKIPKDAKNYFTPKREKEIKEKYGMWYHFHTVLSIVILLAPFIVFMFMLPDNALEPSTQKDNILGGIGGIIGLAASMSTGLGLANIFMCLIKQYLGHIVTLVAIISGLILYMLAIFVFSFVK